MKRALRNKKGIIFRRSGNLRVEQLTGISMRDKRLVVLLVVFIFVAFAGTGIAEDWIKPGEERFRINAGAFLAYFDTSLQVDSKTLGEGTEINLEDDLDLDETSTTYLIDGYWRFAARHRLYAGYFVFDREAGGQVNKELIIDGETYPVGAGYDTDFNFSVVPISYGYSFINNEKHELTGIVGLHWCSVDFGITGYLTPGSATETGQTSATADAPLPLIGFSYEYRFTDRWTASVLASAFYLKASSSSFAFSGSLLNLGLKTEYWLFNNVGLGAALNYFNLNADVEDDDWYGDLDYQYFGPQIYLTIRF
jgi:hypothetical protein